VDNANNGPCEFMSTISLFNPTGPDNYATSPENT